MAAGRKKKEEKEGKKLPRRSPAGRSGDVVRISAKDGESCAEILKAMKARVNPQDSGAEVLSIRRTRRKEILLVLRKWGDVSAFEKAVGEKAEIKSLVLKRSLKVSDLDETVTREEDVAALCKRWASQSSGTSAGFTSASAVCRLRWSV